MFISDFRHIGLPIQTAFISRRRRHCPDRVLGVVIIEIERRALPTEDICRWPSVEMSVSLKGSESVFRLTPSRPNGTGETATTHLIFFIPVPLCQ